MQLFESPEQKPAFTPSKNFLLYKNGKSEQERIALLEKILKTYKLSPSHLNKYNQCPKSFLFECFLRVKYPPSPAMLKGTVVHGVLEWTFKALKMIQEFPDPNLTKVEFKRRIFEEQQKNDIHLDPEEEQMLLQLVLTYIETFKPTWNRIVLTEFYVQKAIWQGIPLTGFIDKIEFNGRNVNIVDYKTGNIERALQGMEPNGNYWTQLIFYAVLLEIQKPEWNAETVEMCLISPTESGNFINKKILISEQDKALVKEQINITYSKIEAFEFEVGCQKPDCYWCNHPV